MPDDRLALEALAADIVELAGDGIIAADEDGRILVFNRAAEETFGYAAEEVLGLPVEVLLPERFRRTHRGQVQQFAAGVGPARRREVVGRRKDDGEFPLEATLARRDVDGRPTLIAVVRDVGEREREREVEGLLVREMEHRVKNLLATVQALVVQTLHGSPSPDDFVNAFSSRLAALADVHALLIESRWAGAPLRELVLRQLAPYRSAERENTIAGEAVVLGPEAALALNLALHELATNAAKYGALSVPKGRVEVLWRVEDDPPGARRLVLKWAERDGPVVRQPREAGFGCRLIERGVAHGLGGTARLEFPPEGARCRIELPLAAEERRRVATAVERNSRPRASPL